MEWRSAAGGRGLLHSVRAFLTTRPAAATALGSLLFLWMAPQSGETGNKDRRSAVPMVARSKYGSRATLALPCGCKSNSIAMR